MYVRACIVAISFLLLDTEIVFRFPGAVSCVPGRS